ncbi:MAG: TetR family transcriptional regulator [Myxococcota bacterium]
MAGSRTTLPDEPEARAGQPVARLAASQLRRMRRIVDEAVRLAERGGFDAVRLRDVALASDVALGTLYKYFHSKEDILLFALTEEVERLEASVQTRGITGGSPVARLTHFFRRATSALVRRPDFARAVVRSIASGDPEHTAKVASFHLRMTRLILAALDGAALDAGSPVPADIGTEAQRQLASVLQQVWFASLVGWAGGLHPARVVAEQVEVAAGLLLGPPPEI